MEAIIVIAGLIILCTMMFKANKWKRTDCARPCPLCGTKSPAGNLFQVNGIKSWSHTCPKCKHGFYTPTK